MGSPMSRAVDRSSRTVLTTPVYDTLRERIMDQSLQAGQRLNIDALAAELKVSPTPLREALARLAAERLVAFEPYKGYTVSPLLTRREAADLMHVRKLLEVEAVRLAVPRLGLLVLRELEVLMNQMERAQVSTQFQDYLQFIQLDQRFHEVLIGASENAVLLITWRSLNAHIQLLRFYRNYEQYELHSSNAEHRAIYTAMRAGNTEAAIQAVQDHLDHAFLRAMEPSVSQRTLLSAASDASLAS